MHVNVLLNGRLEGKGEQAECEVMVKRDRTAAVRSAVYTDPVVIHVAKDLPEGEYVLHCENLSVPVVHKGVLWIVSAPPPAQADAPAPDGGVKPERGPVGMARRLIRDRRKGK